MVRKVRNKRQWVVVSEATGKRLSRPFKTRKAAIERLREIEYFKHKGE